MVAGYFPQPSPDEVQTVTRYLQGKADQRFILTRYPATGDCHIEYDDRSLPDGPPKPGFTALQHFNILTGDGELLDTSGMRKPPEEDAVMLTEAFHATSEKPLGPFNRMLLNIREIKRTHGRQ